MRIWSLHPEYLDRQGLVACWRESLLAQKVLAGKTVGYTRHPQLTRFRVLDDPLAGIGSYLQGLADEAGRRGYRFDVTRIVRSDRALTLTVTRGQLEVEASHLLAKLKERSPERVAGFPKPADLLPHPLFTVVPGPVADWERARSQL